MSKKLVKMDMDEYVNKFLELMRHVKYIKDDNIKMKISCRGCHNPTEMQLNLLNLKLQMRPFKRIIISIIRIEARQNYTRPRRKIRRISLVRGRKGSSPVIVKIIQNSSNTIRKNKVDPIQLRQQE